MRKTRELWRGKRVWLYMVIYGHVCKTVCMAVYGYVCMAMYV